MSFNQFPRPWKTQGKTAPLGVTPPPLPQLQTWGLVDRPGASFPGCFAGAKRRRLALGTKMSAVAGKRCGGGAGLPRLGGFQLGEARRPSSAPELLAGKAALRDAACQAERAPLRPRGSPPS